MDINWLVENAFENVKKHRLAQGAYKRWLWQDANNTRNLGISEYGCADAANILYTLGRFPTDLAERAAFVQNLQSLQDADSGLYREPTHHFIHTTAHCTATLELFDAKPLYKMKALSAYTTAEGLYQFLESVDYAKNPWDGSHLGAGIYAALVLNGEVDAAWQKAYFDWFWEEADPESGFWRKGYVYSEDKPVFIIWRVHFIIYSIMNMQKCPCGTRIK